MGTSPIKRGKTSWDLHRENEGVNHQLSAGASCWSAEVWGRPHRSVEPPLQVGQDHRPQQWQADSTWRRLLSCGATMWPATFKSVDLQERSIQTGSLCLTATRHGSIQIMKLVLQLLENMLEKLSKVIPPSNATRLRNHLLLSTSEHHTSSGITFHLAQDIEPTRWMDSKILQIVDSCRFIGQWSICLDSKIYSNIISQIHQTTSDDSSASGLRRIRIVFLPRGNNNKHLWFMEIPGWVS